MPNGDGIVGWDVGMAFGSDEAENLKAYADDYVRYIELTSRFDLYLAPNSAAVTITFLGF